MFILERRSDRRPEWHEPRCAVPMHHAETLQAIIDSFRDSRATVRLGVQWRIRQVGV